MFLFDSDIILEKFSNESSFNDDAWFFLGLILFFDEGIFIPFSFANYYDE